MIMTYRLDQDNPLTHQELDDNFAFLERTTANASLESFGTEYDLNDLRLDLDLLPALIETTIIIYDDTLDTYFSSLSYSLISSNIDDNLITVMNQNIFDSGVSPAYGDTHLTATSPLSNCLILRGNTEYEANVSFRIVAYND